MVTRNQWFQPSVASFHKDLLFRNPEGWPENSPIFFSSLNSYRVLVPCHKHLTPKYREYVSQTSGIKDVYHLKSVEDISRFLAAMESQHTDIVEK